MSIVSIQTAIELGLLYTLMTFGLFISYRILDIPDLTVDGSFTLGAAVSAVFVVGGHPFLGLLFALVAGALAGVVTATLQTKLKVQPILAGILTMTGLYSVNIMVMKDKANVSLLGADTIFTYVKNLFGEAYGTLIIGVIIVLIISLALILFFNTKVGLSIRATGDNEDMVRSSSINVDAMKILGLALANAMVAGAGALISQKQAFSDAGMGTGMVVIGIASLIIGEVIVDTGIKRRTNEVYKGIIDLVIWVAAFGVVVHFITPLMTTTMGLGGIGDKICTIICFIIAFMILTRLLSFVLKERTINVNIFAAIVGSIIYRMIISAALAFKISASSMKLVSAVIVGFAISYPVIKDSISLKMKQSNRKRSDLDHANN